MPPKVFELTDLERKLIEQICETPKCYNGRERGYILCIACLHGVSDRASDEAVALKKRLEKKGEWVTRW